MISHCNRIHSSLTAVRCFDNGYVGKQPVAWKEYYVEYWLKEPQESMDSCTGHHDIIEILLKMVLNTKQSTINLKIWLEEDKKNLISSICSLFRNVFKN